MVNKFGQPLWFCKENSYNANFIYAVINSYTEDVMRSEVLGARTIGGEAALITGNVFFCSDSNNCNFLPTPDKCTIRHGIVSDNNNLAGDVPGNICEELEADYAPGMECEGGLIGDSEAISVNLTFFPLSILNETTMRGMYNEAKCNEIQNFLIWIF